MAASPLANYETPTVRLILANQHKAHRCGQAAQRLFWTGFIVTLILCGIGTAAHLTKMGNHNIIALSNWIAGGSLFLITIVVATILKLKSKKLTEIDPSACHEIVAYFIKKTGMDYKKTDLKLDRQGLPETNFKTVIAGLTETSMAHLITHLMNHMDKGYPVTDDVKDAYLRLFHYIYHLAPPNIAAKLQKKFAVYWDVLCEYFKTDKPKFNEGLVGFKEYSGKKFYEGFVSGRVCTLASTQDKLYFMFGI